MDRLEPFEVAKPGRRPELGDRLAARAPLLILAPAVVDHQPHPNAGGVPARGAEPAEMRARGRRLVEMKGLRIEARGKRFDVLGGEGVAARLALFARPKGLAEIHKLLPAFGGPCPPALAALRPDNGRPTTLITGSQAAV